VVRQKAAAGVAFDGRRRRLTVNDDRNGKRIESGHEIFQPVIDTRAHELVIDQITFGIRSGVFRVGERLPSISELARQFGVSKPTVGEAVRILVTNGVVSSKRGVTGGVTVSSDDLSTTLLGLVPERRMTDMREVLEARRAVEMEIAVLAGRRGNDGDYASMQESIDLLRAHADEQRLRFHYDHLFHYAMARSAHSDLLAHYQHQTLKQMVVLWPEYFFEQEDPERVIDLHTRTLAALKGRKRQTILRVMDEHLSVVERAAAALLAARGK
jgi:GntR family transcriptional regulator, transcriptional repressor for pyruvate dehydrogenase complex